VKNPDSLKFIDGICVPKMDTLKDMKIVEADLKAVEDRHGLEPGSIKVIP